MCGIVRVARDAEGADHAAATIGEFVEVGLADDDCASLKQLVDKWSIRGGEAVGEESRAGGGANSGDIDEVLERDWNAVKRAAVVAACDFIVGRSSLRECRFSHYGDKGVQRAVESSDAVETGLGEFERRDTLRAQAF